MILNYIKIGRRSLFRYKSHSIINLLGLTVGLATFILISIYVLDELSYDRQFADAENIYRLESEIIYQGEESHWAATTGQWIPRMIERYPEIETGTRLLFSYFPRVFTYEDKNFTEKRVFFVDSTFMDVFNFRQLSGDGKKLLNKPGQAVITESTAKKYFGYDDPVGKILIQGEAEYTISSVCKDPANNAHFHFDILLSLETLRTRWPAMDEPGPSAFHSYIKLNDNPHSLAELKPKVQKDIIQLAMESDETDETLPEDYSIMMTYTPLTDIHLYSHREKELEPNGSYSTVLIFITIAILVLLIACINYMNLTTARSFKRAREVGVRKVVGAGKANIFFQFLTESMILTFIALVMAVFMVELSLPYFNELTGKALTLRYLNNPQLVGMIAVAFIFTGISSGFYPGIILSGFNPIHVFKSGNFTGKSEKTSLYLRRGLVIFQYAVSVILLICSIFIFKQLTFILNKDLGFDKDQIAILPSPDGKFDLMNKGLENQSFVKSSSAISSVPGERIPFLSVRIPALAEDGSGEEDNDGSEAIRVLCTGMDVVETLGLQIVDGRGFSHEFGTDSSAAFILNQAAVEKYGLENPVGMDFEYTYNMETPKTGKIIGIVKDFHYASLHFEVEPLMIHIFPLYNRNLMVKISTDDMPTAISAIEKVWKDRAPDVPFDFYFLNTRYDELYKAEINLRKIVSYFTFLSVFVAALGLLGLTSFITEQRKKEIAIRKVLGASFMSIINNLSKEFIYLVVIANIVAWFPAYYFLNKWLKEFAFQINLTIVPFLLIAIIVIVLTMIIIFLTSSRAVNSNPVKALQYE
ncbi:MAG: FtsX-like permease family protein [Candidatus Marinimicrobia bacterium]|nr:FtsX-like permease family protein [Candidatus Neomarinimicrobiota bacterium]MBT3632857.1 FtsX-like permease family protein [Candidatus Neomarinimicrobiota bacterium]MBT3681967.1 FtsX-like permease family protein [Candidatus Neomarinimicrobiota bacterium]MBT3759004.1 FtsX-like permease family protein [Candidatus Neomarinimicrobiota bacterium]MBT3895097.1 FtsX-like permease family protein [Candidatus Neomarinimicrobiota bacterium]